MELTKEQEKKLLLNYKDKVYFLKGENKKEIIVITPVQQHTIRYLGKINREYQIKVNGRLVYIPKEDTVFMIGFDYTIILDGILFHVVKFFNSFDIVINGVSALGGIPKGKNKHYIANLKKIVKFIVKGIILIILIVYVQNISLDYVKRRVIEGVLIILLTTEYFKYIFASIKALKENDF